MLLFEYDGVHVGYTCTRNTHELDCGNQTTIDTSKLKSITQCLEYECQNSYFIGVPRAFYGSQGCMSMPNFSHDSCHGCYIEVLELTCPLGGDIRPCRGVRVVAGWDHGHERLKAWETWSEICYNIDEKSKHRSACL